MKNLFLLSSLIFALNASAKPTCRLSIYGVTTTLTEDVREGATIHKLVDETRGLVAETMIYEDGTAAFAVIRDYKSGFSAEMPNHFQSLPLLLTLERRDRKVTLSCSDDV